jgi:hypothetical protein
LKNKKEKTDKDYAAIQKLESELEMATQVLPQPPKSPFLETGDIDRAGIPNAR